MKNKTLENKTAFDQPCWKAYQQARQREARRRQLKDAAKYSAVLLVLLSASFIVLGELGTLSSDSLRHVHQNLLSGITPGKFSGNDASRLSKTDLHTILSEQNLLNLQHEKFDLMAGDQRLRIDTTLDIPLQNYIIHQIQKKSAVKRGRPKYIGIVAMEPGTGKILAMAGYDNTGSGSNPCTNADIPAASVFKIVTAAAAIEEGRLNPNSSLHYNGRKYTLYKSQLKETRNKYTRRSTLRESFAQSINPVFGKMGKHLGKDALAEYGSALGFNRYIPFEIPLAPSSLTLSDEPYQWAEIASGFNRETTISPLHAALMAAAVVNQGNLPEPTIIEYINDTSGQFVYQSDTNVIDQAFTSTTSKKLNHLMKATIESGTCREKFRGYQKDPVLSRLNIGGKSGSINNKQGDARIDWFVGYASEKNGHEKLALAVVVAHGKYRGVRAAQYARMVMKQHFKNYFAQTESKEKSA
jgi:cell division protein FtsI/penicillin-binding protein 2